MQSLLGEAPLRCPGGVPLNASAGPWVLQVVAMEIRTKAKEEGGELQAGCFLLLRIAGPLGEKKGGGVFYSGSGRRR